MGSTATSYLRCSERTLICLLVCLSLLLATGCRYTPTSRMESVDSSLVNKDGSYRVTVLRESSNAALTSPWIYVYLTRGSDALNKKPGDWLLTSQIAFGIAGAWPVNAIWIDNTHIQILCDGCGAPLAWASEKKDRLGDVQITYSGFPEVPHELRGSDLANPHGTLRAEQFSYMLPNNPIADSTTVRVERLTLQRDKSTVVRVNGRWPEDVLELRKTRPLVLRWSDDKTLVISCEACGRRLSDATIKLDSIYGVEVKFEGFKP